MKVHSYLGNGFPEIIYQRSLAIELKKSKLVFQQEVNYPVYYDNVIVGNRYADFIVEDKILLELKAISEIETGHYAQVLNYLKAYKLEIGLLINFGSKSLQFKRLINSSQSAKSGNHKNQ
jgi:GxxExxY protein